MDEESAQLFVVGGWWVGLVEVVPQGPFIPQDELKPCPPREHCSTSGAEAAFAFRSVTWELKLPPPKETAVYLDGSEFRGRPNG